MLANAKKKKNQILSITINMMKQLQLEFTEMTEVKMICLNVNGLRGNNGALPNRRKIFSWLRHNNADICFLQETHSDSTWSN